LSLSLCIVLPPYAVGAAGAVPLIDVKLLFGAHAGLPSNLNVPPVGVVETLVLYFVLVLMEQAVACAQLHFVRG